MKKRMIAAVLALVMVATGIYVTKPEATEVKAVENVLLNPDVLGVKMQVGNEKNDTVDLRIVSSVDSLDYSEAGFEIWYDDDAKAAPESKPTISFSTTTVLKRINASSDGVTYNYSPKVVDTSSEYFVTATMKNIKKSNLEKDFYIRAYCKSLDGTETCYGVGRYFSVKKATAANIINIPVEMAALPSEVKVGDEITVTVAGVETTAEVVAYLEGYAHLNVTVPEEKYLGDKTNLASASEIMVTETEESAVYRNLESKLAVGEAGTVTGDSTWYTIDESATEFVIATAADLYGLAAISKSFAGKTIHVVADIAVNDMSVEAMQAAYETETTEDDPIAWTPIGKTFDSDATKESFEGTFDGGNHTISGVSMSRTGVNGSWGLFGITGDCTIQNLTLADSCLQLNTANPVQLGGIAGKSSGTFDTVKVENVYLICESTNDTGCIGGLVGQMTGTGDKKFTNCWFDGKITAGAIVGGILGSAYQTALTDEVTIEHCLNSGTQVLNRKTNVVGGLCGAIDESKLKLEDSLNVGNLVTSNYDKTYYGSAIGWIRMAFGRDTSSDVAVIHHTYAIGRDGGWERFASLSSLGTYRLDGVSYPGSPGGAIGVAQCLSTASLEGEAGYVNMNLDFTIADDYAGYWTATNGTPVLSSFLGNETVTAVKEIATPRTVWYVPGTYADTDTYTLYTKADMYGFASLSADVTFADKTVRLGADITMNDGTVSEWEGASYAGLAKWTARDFAGTFDGDNHTLQGIYLDEAKGNVGLFATVSGMVKNLRLQNSYFNCTATTAKDYESKTYTAPIGSIAGTLSGMLDTVYSDAVVKHAGAYAGGLAGIIKDTGTTNTITNCCYAGSVSANSGVGGILGLVVDANATIEHCLNTGEITGGRASGGLCGYVWNTNATAAEPKLTLKDSLNVGKYSNTETAKDFRGSAIGYVRNAATTYICADVDNTYGLWTDVDDSVIWDRFAHGSNKGQITVDDNAPKTGLVTYNLWIMTNIINKRTASGTPMNLSFYAEGTDSSSDGGNKTCWWIDEAGRIPMLESFADLLRTTAE